MSTQTFYRLPCLSVIDVTGKDALRIANNLTTNEIVSLDDHCGRESFVTDVKGKTVGHVWVYRDGPSLRLIGPAGQTDPLAAHFDRYTIVEDAEVSVLDDQFSVFVLPPDSVPEVIPDFHCGRDCQRARQLEDRNDHGYEVSWLGSATVVVLVPREQEQAMQDRLCGLKLSVADEQAFHHNRTVAGFPWFGIDFSDNNLPQEVARDAQAISFTKGCYLGQETVARLDAMGQVQKKLVRWTLRGEIPDPNVEVTSGGKTVGRLTSIARTSDNEAKAIGIARRSHFEPGAEATGASRQGGFTATVS